MSRIVIWASGEGSNAENLIHYSRTLPNVEIVGIVTNRSQAPVVERARRLQVPCYHIDSNNDQQQIALMKELRAEWAFLAGYMKLLSPEVLHYFRGPFMYQGQDILYRVFNIHPSLLPKFKGANALRRSFDSQDDEVGVTVHFVDEGMDTGPIFLQQSVRVTSEMRSDFFVFKETIHKLEYECYPKALKWVVTEYSKQK
ncbi:MAG: phosphoribosylglycinamide formyltransferase [Bdellovibrionaceae bacterium]|nr:phosphoribosylglycinamide formyltransferase [Pseudobdellovibrionaceae bacterium]MDW8190118.1 phosphoribosylglycinamide formyltransferase [Pseudobdellovibrionaceae bacterium]